MSRVAGFASRGRRCRRGALAALAVLTSLACFGAGAAPALAIIYDDIEVTVEPQPAMEGAPLEMRSGSYIEFRVTVRNRSKSQDHEVRLVHADKERTPYYGDFLQRNSRTIRAPHGSTLTVSLFAPALTVFNESLAVEIDGLRKQGVVELSSPYRAGYGYYSGARSTLVVLASRGVPQELKDKVRAANGLAAPGCFPAPSPVGFNEVAFCRSELATNQWSPNWLGYSAYDVVLMTEVEAASLPAEVLLALRRYVEAGGIVLVTGSKSVGGIVPPGLRDPDRMRADEDGAFHVGFGLVRPCPAPPWPILSWSSQVRDEVAPLDRDVQIVREITVPVRGLLLLVISFAIGIGPLNLWILSRRQKRMWLWWNVPAVSLATCLVVFAYSLFSEGLRGRGRSALITLLDENIHRATTFGYVSYYCPLTPSDGLRFSYDTAVAQLRSGGAAPLHMGAGRGKTVDWTADQHLDYGWIMARTPACFTVRKSETRRERLTVRNGADGSLTVVNGLGTPIDSLFYCDESGALAVASDVQPGQERQLAAHKSASAKSVDGVRPLRALFNQGWSGALRELKSSPELYLTPGCYVALVKQSPFLEDPLPAAPQDGSTGVIFGIGARADHGR